MQVVREQRQQEAMHAVKRKRLIRAEQTLLTGGFISKLGLALIAAPVFAYVFDLPAHVAGVQPGAWPLLGLWWVVLRLYLHVLGFALAGSVR